METKNIMIVGVGGQGSLLASKLLGNGNKYPQIQKANGLSGSLIKVGQKLKIPKG